LRGWCSFITMMAGRSLPRSQVARPACMRMRTVTTTTVQLRRLRVAHLNKVLLIGRLTRDPESRSFQNGGKVVQFGFALNNRKKQGDEWVDDPVFLDMKAFNSQYGRKLADIIEEHGAKGKLAYVEGHLLMEQWEDKNDGSKRSKLKIVVDNIQFL